MQRQRKSWSSSSAEGCLKLIDLAALRVDARHDVLDRAVLAGGVHRLEDDQDGVAVVGVEAVPGPRPARARLSSEDLGRPLLDRLLAERLQPLRLRPAGVSVRQAGPLPGLDPESVDHLARDHGLPSMPRPARNPGPSPDDDRRRPGVQAEADRSMTPRVAGTGLMNGRPLEDAALGVGQGVDHDEGRRVEVLDDGPDPADLQAGHDEKRISWSAPDRPPRPL